MDDNDDNPINKDKGQENPDFFTIDDELEENSLSELSPLQRLAAKKLAAKAKEQGSEATKVSQELPEVKSVDIPSEVLSVVDDPESDDLDTNEEATQAEAVTVEKKPKPSRLEDDGPIEAVIPPELDFVGKTEAAKIKVKEERSTLSERDSFDTKSAGSQSKSFPQRTAAGDDDEFNLRNKPPPSSDDEFPPSENPDNGATQGGGGGSKLPQWNPVSQAIMEEDENSNEWLMTYADMVTLLLSFFVLMYSVSTADLSKFKDVMESVQTTLAGKPAGNFVVIEELEPQAPDVPVEIAADTKMEEPPEAQLLREISNFIEEAKLEEQLDAHLSGEKIVIRLTDQLVFNSGSAVLNNSAIPVFDAIILIIAHYPDFNVNIKGHTDNIPIETERFPSNWELSAIRATTVLRYFIDQGVDPLRLTATGYGSIIPIKSNETEYGRSFNRRVEFVLQNRIEVQGEKELHIDEIKSMVPSVSVDTNELLLNNY